MTQTKQVEQLKLNVTNIHSFLVKENKRKEKLSVKKEDDKKRKISFQKKQQKEKQLEAKKAEKSEKNASEQVIKTSSMSLLDKLFNFGGLLLGGILVNAADGIVKEGKKFYTDNKELFDTIGGFLNGVKDAAVGLFNSFTGPYSEEGAFDDFAKFDDSGKLQSGTLKKVEDAYNGFGDLINKIDKAMGGKGTAGNFIKTDTTSSTPMPSREELVNQTERGSGMASFREDAAENAALQESVRGQTSEGSPTGQVSSNTNITPLQQQALGVLAKYESGVHGYEAVNQIGTKGGRGVLGFSGSFTNMKQHGGISLTSLTIGDIKKLQYDDGSMTNQQWISAGKLHAVGRYQFIGNTLPGVAKRAGIPDSAKFDSNVQDLMALQLMKERGISPWVGPSDKATAEERRIVEQARKQPITYNRTTSKTEAKITPVPDKGDKTKVLNQRDPRKNRRGRTVAFQRVNTIQTVPYMMPVPTKSRSSSTSQPQLPSIWSA